MTGNPEETGGATASARSAAPSGQVAPRGAAPGETERPRSGPVVELALVAAGLGLVGYLLGFVDDAGSGTQLTVSLLLGGGLLAGSAALPTVGARALAPAAVACATGALLLLRGMAGGATSAVAIGGLALALLEAAAAVAAALLHAGVVRAPRPRPRNETAPPLAGQPPQAAHPGQPHPVQQYPAQQPPPPAYPGQPYPGQPYPAPPYPGDPYGGDQYAGEHAYAQNARYGAQYGVPGYPPPPPYGAPGYDPSVSGTGGYPGRGDGPVAPTGPAAEAPTALTGTERYRSGVPTSAGASGTGAAGVSGTGASGPGSHGGPGPEAAGTSPVHGSGAYRPSWVEPSAASSVSGAAPAGSATSGTAPSSSGMAGSGASGSGASGSGASGSGTSGSGTSGSGTSGPGTSGPGTSVKTSGSHAKPDPDDDPSGGRATGDDDRTRAIPRVTDQH
jgi:hypothetical protein